MPMIRGRYYANPAYGQAMENEREREAAVEDVERARRPAQRISARIAGRSLSVCVRRTRIASSNPRSARRHRNQVMAQDEKIRLTSYASCAG